MTPDGSSFRIISAETADTIDLLSAVLRRATDMTISLGRIGDIKAVVVNDQSTISRRLDHWVGQHVHTVLTTESRVKIDRAVEAASKITQTGLLDLPPMELNHIDSTGWSRPMRYSFVKVAGDETLLLLGHDLQAVADAQQILVRTQTALENEAREQRDRNALFTLLKTHTQDPVVFLNGESGRVTDITEPAGVLLETASGDVIGKPLERFVSQSDWDTFDRNILRGDGSHGYASVTLQSGKRITIEAAHFRTAKETVILCKLTDDDQANVSGDVWTSFLRSGSDAMIVTDDRGAIKFTNSAYLSLVEEGSAADVAGAGVSEYLGRGQVDFQVMMDAIADNGPLAHYQTEVKTRFGARVPVSIAISPLRGSDPVQYGLSIRELSGEAFKGQRSIQDADSVAELVGKVSLKDIVSQTTDVIEKICIETAIQMTKNNRFAAAEMLNLSRQSLYVKLRKYGLIERSDED
ncbi:MAG: transcriptional regulator PpsR [Pseudomonadota bacterium]